MGKRRGGLLSVKEYATLSKNETDPNILNDDPP
jgi:hypothetical protein